MREPKALDYTLLTILALIWASAFFNIKIATYSYGPLTIAFLRILFGPIPVVILCYFKKNGITKLINPIVANQYQSFEKASILTLLKKQMIKSGIDPKNTLKKAIVTGP